ncbi:MAG: hypothetical protein ACYC5H_10430 [Methylovirgula sp.]
MAGPVSIVRRQSLKRSPILGQPLLEFSAVMPCTPFLGQAKLEFSPVLAHEAVTSGEPVDFHDPPVMYFSDQVRWSSSYFSPSLFWWHVPSCF